MTDTGIIIENVVDDSVLIIVKDVATALTASNNSITNAKLVHVGVNTIKGRITAGTGVVEDLTATQVRTIINVANGATANDTDANLRARASHSGTQAAATISDFDAAAFAAIVDRFVYNETPAGVLDSVNTIFTTANVYVGNKTQLFLNGMRMKVTNDYTHSGVSQITFVEAPFFGDNITIDYIK